MKQIYIAYLSLSSLLSSSFAFTTTPPSFASSNSYRSASTSRNAIIENNHNNHNVDEDSNIVQRRSFMKNVLTKTAMIMSATTTAVVSSSTSLPALAMEEGSIAASTASSSLVDVYFGVGCYWHIQHEFVVAERKLLQRTDSELTSRTGYAGGKSTDNEGRVCYHNFMGVADYGKLGHGEVVGMKIPENKIGDFAKEYFDLFTEKGERVDPMDRGGEYRSLLGLPNGDKNPYYPTVEAAAKAKGMTLELGKGNDPDTLGTKKVYVYDSTKYPFYQAEIYHQFHNDFQSPPYGKQYNDLQKLAFDDGRLQITGCPDKV